MATEGTFVTISLNGRNARELEELLRDHAGPAPLSLSGAGSNTATVRVPTNAERRAEVLRIIREWREAGAE